MHTVDPHARAIRALAGLLVAIALAWSAATAGAPPEPAGATRTDVYVFWREGCPHCEVALAWLAAVEPSLPGVAVHRFEVGANAEHRALLMELSRHFGLDRVAVPMIVVGETPFVGFLDAASTGRDIEAAIRACTRAACPDVVGPRRPDRGPPAGDARAPGAAPQPATLPPAANGEAPPTAPRPATVPSRLRLPLVGEIETAGLSLVALTALLAAADGFNPCAMWTLVFLLGLIQGMQDRLRMWVLGIAFVAASAGVYFLFMAAWLNVLLVLGMLVWLRLALGAIAIGGGVYALARGFSPEPPVCQVTAPASRRRLLDALRSLALERRFLLALAGIVLIAIAVNAVELICSAGIPAVYTQVLAMSEMPRWQHYAYLALYVAVFMLDDLVVLIATLGAVTLAARSASYTRWSNRLGGIILIVLGLLLVFRPQLLVIT